MIINTYLLNIYVPQVLEDDIETNWKGILTVEGLGKIQGRNLKIKAHTVSVEDEGTCNCFYHFYI